MSGNARRTVPGETGDDDEDSAPIAGRPNTLSMARTTHRRGRQHLAMCRGCTARAPSSAPLQKCGRRIRAPIPWYGTGEVDRKSRLEKQENSRAAGGAHAKQKRMQHVADEEDDDAPPASFLCPIMGDLMHDPVTCFDGMSYQRPNIARWLAENDTSPVTGQRLASKALISNHALRAVIEDWEDARAARARARAAAASCSLSLAPTTTAITTMEGDAAPTTAPEAVAVDIPIEAGQPILYQTADGGQLRATVTAVHPGDAADPTPFYTIRLDDGSERDTVRTRLSPAPPASPAANAAARAERPSPVAEEEEEARRQAVERSRLEARQARAERRKQAEAAAERAGSLPSGGPRRTQHRSSGHPRTHESASSPLDEMFSHVRSGIDGIRRDLERMSTPSSASPPRPPHQPPPPPPLPPPPRDAPPHTPAPQRAEPARPVGSQPDPLTAALAAGAHAVQDWANALGGAFSGTPTRASPPHAS